MFNLIRNNNFSINNVRYMSTKFNPKKYLLGNNDNLVGTILAIRKGLVKSKYLEYELDSREVKDIKDAPKVYSPEAYSILLYFDHRTARIVRFLFNPNMIFWNRKPNLYNFYRDESQKLIENDPSLPLSNVHNIDASLKKYYVDYNIDDDDSKTVYSKVNKLPFLYNQMEIDPSEKDVVPNFILDNDKYNMIQDEYKKGRNFKFLFDGKISKRMVALFLIQLHRDYLHNKIQCKNCDMEELYNTFLDTQGSEVVNVEPVFDYPENKVIYIPKSISVPNYLVDRFSNDHNVTFEHKGILDLPPVINDLRSFINPGLVQNKKFLINRIERFNNSLAKKLSK